MYEEALKRLPQNEEMAAQTFCAYVRCAKWKNGQLVSISACKWVLRLTICDLARDEDEQDVPA